MPLRIDENSGDDQDVLLSSPRNTGAQAQGKVNIQKVYSQQVRTEITA